MKYKEAFKLTFSKLIEVTLVTADHSGWTSEQVSESLSLMAIHFGKAFPEYDFVSLIQKEVEFHATRVYNRTAEATSPD